MCWSSDWHICFKSDAGSIVQSLISRCPADFSSAYRGVEDQSQMLKRNEMPMEQRIFMDPERAE